MKIEFIIDHNEYKKLLSKEKIGKQITVCSEKLKGKNNYLLTLSKESKNVTTAKLLSDSRIAVEKLFADNNIKYRLLTDEASQFFVKRLYPYATEFETKLRKFIYTALFDIDEKAEIIVVGKYKRTMLSKGEDKTFVKLPQNDFLASSDLGQIFDFLFSNDEFLEEVKKVNNNDNNNKGYDRRLTKKKLIEKIEGIEEKTIWNLLFAPYFDDSVLPVIYDDLQKYRNDIMHMHYISYGDYIKAQRAYIRGIKDLNYQLSKKIIIEDTESNVDTLASSLGYLRQFLLNAKILQNSAIEVLKQFTPSYLDSLQAVSAAFAPITEQYAKIQSSLQILNSPISETLSKIAEINRSYEKSGVYQNIDDTVRLLGKNLEVVSTVGTLENNKDEE